MNQIFTFASPALGRQLSSYAPPSRRSTSRFSLSTSICNENRAIETCIVVRQRTKQTGQVKLRQSRSH
ncbi:hypothetical protein CY34DRAFT_206547 [Suillus luteus UH-Slu-Lm8-n1]|uniref:Uncharacterized protein n=1 Tax=Suillus luteus UH-Slu-Lm8-n1 TaxID=930992 RepID=A0A0D0B4H9_9AGAM|nr:hypothetical protein CY34DRAFT_206547 [Suillus luteus UH-Slu-Lm8-n1]